MRFIKKIFKVLGILIILGIVAFGILYFIYNQPLPEGQPGPEADALAQKMLKAVNHEQYKNTRFLEWTYAGGLHKYKWDKENGKVNVKWNDYEVWLNLNSPSKSEVYEENVKVIGDQKEKLIQKATDYFNNDSFWVVAPFKVFDDGTKRSLVKLEDGTNGLLVTYTSGGTTPGDSYLWKLQPNGFPESFQMWVKIIPIGGLEATWDDWQIMESGTFLPKSHDLGPITLEVGNPRAYN